MRNGTYKPNAAMIASPINLSTPPCSVMHSTIISKYSFNNFTVPWAPKDSIIFVKLLKSENNKVAVVSNAPHNI